MWKNVLFGIVILAVALGSVGCSKVKKVKKINQMIVKDIRLEELLTLLEKYQGTHAWTRGIIEDLTERVETQGEPKKRVILRDSKVTIVDLTFSFNGAVTVDDPKGRRIIAALDVERPLSVEKIEYRLNEIFWFKDPTLRHVDYIRKWGKKTARAVVNHEVFVGMPSDAAIESWGIPDEVRVSEIGSEKEEQWVYKEAKRSKYIYVIDGKVGRWEE
ncbi:MAG: hypothetical protein JSW58_17690 [Candidatus Latescibacterota bacterium]|nr:MAG: hypothetical protein JSW58_17690 [Candidatus Latescibacterota bacterium]